MGDKKISIRKAIILLLLIAVIIGAFSFGYRSAQKNIVNYVETDTMTVVDTVNKKDTIFCDVPMPCKVLVRDTVFMYGERDTLFLKTKEYRDSTYTAWVSGINANLDSIETYQNTRYLTKTVIKRVSLPADGFFIGLGIITTPDNFAPSVGANYVKGKFLYGADMGVMDNKPLFRLSINYKIN